MSTPATLSNHDTLAAHLTAKKVTRKDVAWVNPRNLADVWKDLHREFPVTETKAVLPFDNAWKILQPVMKKEYDCDAAFHQRLFEALKECFGTYVMTLFQQCPLDPDATTNENFIVLDIDRKQGGKYAVGFARNVSCTVGLVPERTDSSSVGVTKNCKIDLGSCLLLEQGNKMWKATDIFSLAELKTSKTSCNDIEDVEEFNLVANHGPFCQALTSTLGYALLCHARNGVLRNPVETNVGAETASTSTPKKELPLAVISGVIAGPDGARAKKLRWVSGGLLFPEACGNQFQYCLKSFGKYHEDVADDEKNSIAMALSLLLDTLLFGLRAARRVLTDRVGNPHQPDPVSGTKLKIGNQLLDFPLLASPIPKPEHAADQTSSNQALVVSQAEFFRGHLNVSETLAKSEMFPYLFRQFGDANEGPVLVKVTSMAVHPFLISTSDTFSAIAGATDILASPRIDDTGLHGQETVAGALLAVIDNGCSLITIMADLSTQNYAPLRPETAFPSQLSTLWEGFKDLVKGVLLPLASRGVIHADIRPGFDFTTNILVKIVGEGKVRMELVDFESLVGISNWRISETKIGYINPQWEWGATTFVWWQCVFVAFAWLEERALYSAAKQKAANPAVKQADILSLRKGLTLSANDKMLGKQINWHPWLPVSLRKFASNDVIREEDVGTTLDELSKIFCIRDALRPSSLDVATLLEKMKLEMNPSATCSNA